MKNNDIVWNGLIASILALMLFLIINIKYPNFFALDTQWIIVAFVPLILVMFLNGNIRNVKGFGFEIESNIEKPITAMHLTLTQSLRALKGIRKGGINYLNNVEPLKKRITERLILTQGVEGYYDSVVLGIYIESLPSLKYLEIRKPSDEFVVLVPTYIFTNDMGIENDNATNAFVRALERSAVVEEYRDDCIQASIPSTTSIIETLRFMKNTHLQDLVVVDKQGVFVGMVSMSQIESQIAIQVLEANSKK